MNVLKSLCLSVAVAVVALSTVPDAKACDAFFAAPAYGQAFAFSNGGFAYGQSAFFAPSYGFSAYRSPVFLANSYGVRTASFNNGGNNLNIVNGRGNSVVQASSGFGGGNNVNVVNQRFGLFGRLREQNIVQASQGGGGNNLNVVNGRR